jgi:glutamine synthetase
MRMPDPSCNPYLAVAVMIAAGIDGVRERIDPGPPVNKNIFEMSHREKRRLRIDELPENLSEAVTQMRKDPLIREALGDHIYNHCVEAKLAAWAEHNATVHAWEVERYLARY